MGVSPFLPSELRDHREGIQAIQSADEPSIIVQHKYAPHSTWDVLVLNIYPLWRLQVNRACAVLALPSPGQEGAGAQPSPAQTPCSCLPTAGRAPVQAGFSSASLIFPVLEDLLLSPASSGASPSGPGAQAAHRARGSQQEEGARHQGCSSRSRLAWRLTSYQ